MCSQMLCKLDLAAVHHHAVHQSVDDVARTFAAVDTDGDGVISFEEFCSLVVRREVPDGLY